MKCLNAYKQNKYTVTIGNQSKTVDGKYFTDARGFHKDDRRLLGLMHNIGHKHVTLEEGKEINGQWKIVKKTRIEQV